MTIGFIGTGIISSYVVTGFCERKRGDRYYRLAQEPG